MRSQVIINDIEEACKVAEEFSKEIANRFQKFNSKNAKQRQLIEANLKDFNSENIDKTIEKLTPTQKQKLNQSVNTLKFVWKLKQQTDTLHQVYPNGMNADSLNFFINNQKIKKNINKNKQDQLLLAYQKNQWNDPIFSDPLFIQTAFGLFHSGKLKHVEFETLLNIYYARSPLFPTSQNHTHSLNFYPILDDKGEFTDAALKKFTPNLSGYMEQPFNDIQINNFKLLMQAFLKKFPSQNFFFTVISNELYEDRLAMQLSARKLSATLYNQLAKTHPFVGLFQTHNEDEERIILPDIVQNALELSCFHLKDVIIVSSMAGNLPPSDIKRGMFARLRPGAVSYPEVPSNPDIHGLIFASKISRKDHDRYHAQLLDRMGYVGQQALLRMILLADENILMNCQKLQDRNKDELLSAVTWRLTDAEFLYYNELLNPKTDQEYIKNFCDALDTIPGAIVNRLDILFRCENEKVTDKVTDLGLIVFIDMATNKKLWLEFNFNPEYLVGNYKKYFDIAVKIQSHFTDDPKYNIVLFRTYLELGKKNMPEFEKLMQTRFAEMNQSLEFKRNNIIRFLGLIDTNLPSNKFSETTMFTLLKILLPLNIKTPHQDFDYNKYHSLFKNVFLIYLHLNHFPFVRKNILSKLDGMIVDVVEKNDALNKSTLKGVYEILDKFITHHSKLTPRAISDNVIDNINRNVLHYFEIELGLQKEFGVKRGFYNN